MEWEAHLSSYDHHHKKVQFSASFLIGAEECLLCLKCGICSFNMMMLTLCRFLQRLSEMKAMVSGRTKRDRMRREQKQLSKEMANLAEQ